jgi:hypothetical protein
MPVSDTTGFGAKVFVYVGIFDAQQLQHFPHPTSPNLGVNGSGAQHPSAHDLQHPNDPPIQFAQQPYYTDPNPSPIGAGIPTGPT